MSKKDSCVDRCSVCGRMWDKDGSIVMVVVGCRKVRYFVCESCYDAKTLYCVDCGCFVKAEFVEYYTNSSMKIFKCMDCGQLFYGDELPDWTPTI